MKNLLAAFYSPIFYAETAYERQGSGLSYVLVLTLLTLLAAMIPLRETYGPFAEAVGKIPVLAADMPALTIKESKLSMDRPSPYIARFGEGPTGAGVMIDTDYKIADLAAVQEKMRIEHVFMLVTADAYVAQGDNGELKFHDFKDVRPAAISHENWQALGDAVTKWGMPVITVFFAVFFFIAVFIYHFIATFFAAIVLIIIGAIARTRLAFDAAIRLAAAARVPPVVICFLPGIAGFDFIGRGVSWLIWLAYMIFAVVSVRKSMKG